VSEEVIIMERHIYVNGQFWDRVSNTAEEVARSCGAVIEKVEPYHSVVLGECENVYLRID